jgi:hypothetical protein
MADRVDQTIQLGLLVIDPELMDDLLVRLPADLDLLRLGDDVELALVRDGIRGASGEEDEQHERAAAHERDPCKLSAQRVAAHFGAPAC